MAVYWPLVFTATHVPKLPDIYIAGRDKTGHFAAYFLLTLLFWLAKYGSIKPDLRRYRFWLVLAMMLVYASADEVSQGLTCRTPSIMDWFADAAGCLTAFVVLTFMRSFMHWLGGYWIVMFAISHWPTNAGVFIRLPAEWQRFEITYVMAAYAVLTLLFWRCVCKESRFEFNGRVFSISVAVISLYALFDEFISYMMGRGFDVGDLAGAFMGITLASVCAAAFSHHHDVR